MAEKQSNNLESQGESNFRFHDFEERNNLMKDRLLLIGQNLIEMREKISSDLLQLKKENEVMKRNIEHLASFLENISGELPKFARKEDLDILKKQAKMFQPLEFVRKKDLKK